MGKQRLQTGNWSAANTSVYFEIRVSSQTNQNKNLKIKEKCRDIKVIQMRVSTQQENR